MKNQGKRMAKAIPSIVILLRTSLMLYPALNPYLGFNYPKFRMNTIFLTN